MQDWLAHNLSFYISHNPIKVIYIFYEKSTYIPEPTWRQKIGWGQRWHWIERHEELLVTIWINIYLILNYFKNINTIRKIGNYSRVLSFKQNYCRSIIGQGQRKIDLTIINISYKYYQFQLTGHLKGGRQDMEGLKGTSTDNGDTVGYVALCEDIFVGVQCQLCDIKLLIQRNLIT